MADAILRRELVQGAKTNLELCRKKLFLSSLLDRLRNRKIILIPLHYSGKHWRCHNNSVQEQPDSDGYKTSRLFQVTHKQKRPDPRTEEGMLQIKRELQ